MKNAFIIFLIFTWTKVFSCTCFSPTPEEALRKYPVVFIGKLVSTSIDSNFLAPTEFGLQRLTYWTFDVIRYMKGLAPNHSRISIISRGTNCDYNFDYYQTGTEFIIYASQINEFGQLHLLTTNQCSQTKLTSEIKDVFELNYYNDKGSWKTPNPLDPRYIFNRHKNNSELIRSQTSWLIPILILINIGLTFFLIFRRK